MTLPLVPIPKIRQSPNILRRVHQPLYDQQQIADKTELVTFFQEPVVNGYSYKAQTRNLDGKFGPKKTFYVPPNRTYAETNMDTPGFLNDPYHVTGIGILPEAGSKKSLVEKYAETSFTVFNVGNIEHLRLPTIMLLSETNPNRFVFKEPIDIPAKRGFSVRIVSWPKFKAPSPFNIRCVLTGYFGIAIKY